MEKALYHLKVLMLLDNPFVSDVRVDKEAKTLIEQGASLVVICVKQKNQPQEESRNGYQIIRSFEEGFNAPMRIGFKKHIKNKAKQLSELKFDIVHCHDFHMLRIGVEIKKINPKVKLIYDAHEYLAGWPYYHSASKWINRVKGKFVWLRLIKNEQKDIRKADEVITVTTAIAQRLKLNNDLSEIPTVIGNYPPRINIKRNKEYFKNLYHLKENTKVLIHSGTIYQSDEQIHALFNIIQNNPEAALVFIGNRPRFFEIQKMVDQNDKWDNIYFHEYYHAQNDNINLISSGDVGLLHIRDKWEAHRITFSNRFVEYIAAGLPVVGTPQEFAVHLNESFNCCQFYHENNSSELNSGINNILANLEKYSKNAMIAKESLSWEKETTKLLELYRTLLNK